MRPGSRPCAASQRFGSVHQPLDPLARPDAVTGFTLQIALSASNTCSVVISWSFRSCRLGTSRMERSHCFNSSSDSPWHQPGYCFLGKFLERLAALAVGPLLDPRIDAIALQCDLIVARLVARAAQVRTSPLAPSLSPTLANSICARLPSGR